jgi:ABC-2 type transport system ATP-binding protein
MSSAASLHPTVRVDRLSKRFGAYWALRDASFSIRSGEILGLIGPNGSGKTTLFRCVAGLTPATKGTITIDKAPISNLDRKRHLFFVPDGIKPWPDQSVSWVLGFMGRVHGATPRFSAQIASALGLEALSTARLGDLSKGEHQRVMLAIGLLTPQPMLMLDEPFEGLDLRQTREAMRLLRIHAASGRTLFLSIHQLRDAELVCDRLVLLSDGRVVGEGTLGELGGRTELAAGNLEEVFLELT